MSCNNNYKDPMEVLGRSKGHSYKELIENLPRHYKFNPAILQQIKNIPEVILRNHGSPIAKKINRMVKEVLKEAYRAEQFTRTEINNKSVLYGVILLKHKVIDIVLKYFHKRWPNCVVCLYNEYNQKTGIINEQGIIQEVKEPLKKVIDRLSKNRSTSPYFEDIEFSNEEIFDALYQSQNITERENLRFFNSMIPKNCFKLPGMRKGVENKYNNKNRKLDDFIK